MKTAKITHNDVLVDDFYDMPVPGPDELVIKTRSAGICGSDLHRIHALQTSGPSGHICVGHEICGEIYAAGNNVTGIQEGSRIAVEPLHRCGKCKFCCTGHYNLCDMVPFRMVMGWDPNGPGGHSEYFSMPAYSAVPVPDDLSDTEVALVEPLAVGVHAVRMAQISSRSSVAIIGAGSIGLTSLIAAIDAGAAQTIVIGRYEHQRQAALELGATHVIQAEPGTTEDQFRTLLGKSEWPDVVIESVGGSADTTSLALQLARPGGTIMLAGAFWGNSGIAAQPIFDKELSVKGSHTYSRNEHGATDFEHAIELLRTNSKIASTVVTHEFSLNDAKEAYRIAANKQSGSIKVMLRP